MCRQKTPQPVFMVYLADLRLKCQQTPDPGATTKSAPARLSKHHHSTEEWFRSSSWNPTQRTPFRNSFPVGFLLMPFIISCGLVERHFSPNSINTWLESFCDARTLEVIGRRGERFLRGFVLRLGKYTNLSVLSFFSSRRWLVNWNFTE